MERIEILLGELWPFNGFFMLKTTFRRHRLIKISMTYVYIKPEVNKNDTTAMIDVTNEAGIGWLDEHGYLMWNPGIDSWVLKPS